MGQTNVAVRSNAMSASFFFLHGGKCNQSILNGIYCTRGIRNQLYAQSELKRGTKLEFLKIAI